MCSELSVTSSCILMYYNAATVGACDGNKRGAIYRVVGVCGGGVQRKYIISLRKSHVRQRSLPVMKKVKWKRSHIGFIHVFQLIHH